MAFVRVAHASATTADGVSVVTGGINTTGATLLVAVVSGTAASTFTMADSKSNTWTALTQQTLIGGNAERMYYCLSPSSVGSGHTFTATGSAPSICVSSYSGASPALDQSIGATADYPATTAQPGSLTPSMDNCLLITGLGHKDTGTVLIGSSFSITDQVADTYPTGGFGVALAEKIQTTAGAENPQWSWSTTAYAVATMAVFKLGGGGGGGGATFRDDPNYSINYGINLGIT